MKITFKMEIVREVTMDVSAKDLDDLAPVLLQLQEHGTEEIKTLNVIQVGSTHFGDALEQHEAFAVPHGSAPVKLEHLIPALLTKLQSEDKREQPYQTPERLALEIS